VDGPRDQILSDPAFPAQEHRRVGVRDAVDRRPDGAHRGAPLEQPDLVDRVAGAPASKDRHTVCCVSSISLHKPLLLRTLNLSAARARGFVWRH
jgi:hypothetical protein